MKKAAASLLVLLSLYTLTACAASNTRTSGLYTYEFKGNGTLRIVDFDWSGNQGDIYIPSMIDGYEVAIIGERAFAPDEDKYGEPKKYNDVLVTLPNSITSIEDYAFYNAPVVAINIPAKTRSIGVGALLVKPSTNHVNYNVFTGHDTFATIDGNLYNKQTKELLATAETDKILLTIPNGIRAIAAHVFEDKRASVTIPATVSNIGAFAFNRAKEIYMNQSVAVFSQSSLRIEEYAFAQSRLRLDDITTLLNSISNIPSHAFYDIYFGGGSRLVIPGNIKQIDEFAFAGIGGVSVIIIKSGVERLGPSAFEELRDYKKGGMSNHHALIIEDGLQEIGDSCFRKMRFYNHRIDYAYDYDTLVIPGTVQRIGNNAFRDASRYDDRDFIIELKDGVKSIGDNCFDGFKNITVMIPSSVTDIGVNAFDSATVTLVVEHGSHAEYYAIENGITYKYPDSQEDLSWLDQ